MPEQHNRLKQVRADDIPAPRLLAWTEHCLRPVDRLDYAIRRLIIPLPPVVREASPLSELQAAVGRCLRAEYDPAQPIPVRLADLLRRLEQPNGLTERAAA